MARCAVKEQGHDKLYIITGMLERATFFSADQGSERIEDLQERSKSKHLNQQCGINGSNMSVLTSNRKS